MSGFLLCAGERNWRKVVKQTLINLYKRDPDARVKSPPPACRAQDDRQALFENASGSLPY